MVKKYVAIGVAMISACVLNPWPGHETGWGIMLLAAVCFVASMLVLFKK